MTANRRRRRSRRSSFAAVSVFVLLAAGCRPEADVGNGIAGLDGLLVADQGVTVVADQAWRREGAAGGSFRKTAALLVSVTGRPSAGYRFTFHPDGPTSRLHFSARWDEVPLWDEPRRGDEEPLTVDIAAADLAPGLHRLRLDRVKELDAPNDRDRAVNEFTRVDAVRVGPAGDEPQRILADPYLARFLEFGVTSSRPTRLNGALFVGSQRHETALDGRGGELRFTLQNHSPAAARFLAAIDGDTALDVELRAQREAELRVEVPDGSRLLTLETVGSPGGCFLWGAPYFSRPDRVVGPPVVVITLDTTRRDALTPFGSRPDQTPNIARFARHASVYDNAWATAPWTLPSHASIFTGMYPSHHRAGVSDDALAESWLTLAELFRDAGYRTAGFIGGHMTSSSFGMAQGFSMYRDPRAAEEPGDVLTDAALELLEREGDLPLFLFINYFDPHAPYDAPAGFQDRFDVARLAARIPRDSAWAAFARNEPGAWGAIVDGRVPVPDGGLAYLRARYEAEVAFMDAQIGRLFSALDERGLYDPALIVLVADHGEFLGERGLYSHSYRLDPELTAVPLLIKWPGQVEGERVGALVSHVDLYPTIAAAAGLAAAPSDGLDLGAGRVRQLADRERVVMEEHKSRFHQLPGPYRIADHLFGLQWLDAREVFYPGVIECQRRTAGDWRAAGCEHSWSDRLAELPPYMQRTLQLETEVTAADLDEDAAARLRALGYVE